MTCKFYLGVTVWTSRLFKISFRELIPEVIQLWSPDFPTPVVPNFRSSLSSPRRAVVEVAVPCPVVAALLTSLSRTPAIIIMARTATDTTIITTTTSTAAATCRWTR